MLFGEEMPQFMCYQTNQSTIWYLNIKGEKSAGFKIPIGIYSLIKAAHCCKKSSPSYHFNSLNFDGKISSKTTV